MEVFSKALVYLTISENVILTDNMHIAENYLFYSSVFSKYLKQKALDWDVSEQNAIKNNNNNNRKSVSLICKT